MPSVVHCEFGSSYIDLARYRIKVQEIVPFVQRIHAYIWQHYDVYETAAKKSLPEPSSPNAFPNLQCFIILAPSGDRVHILVWGRCNNKMDKDADLLSWGQHTSINVVGHVLLKDYPVAIARSGLRAVIYMEKVPLFRSKLSMFKLHVPRLDNSLVEFCRHKSENIKRMYPGIRNAEINNVAAQMWREAAPGVRIAYQTMALEHASERRKFRVRQPYKRTRSIQQLTREVATSRFPIDELKLSTPVALASGNNVLSVPHCWNLHPWQFNWAAEFSATTIKQHTDFFDAALQRVFLAK